MYHAYLADPDPTVTTAATDTTAAVPAMTTQAPPPQRDEQYFNRRRWQPRQHRPLQMRQQTQDAGRFAPPGYYQAQPRIEARPAPTNSAPTSSSGVNSWLIQGAIAVGAALLVGLMSSKK